MTNMMLQQAGFPDTKVETLDSADKLIIQRFRKGGPRTASVTDEVHRRYYVVDVTVTRYRTIPRGQKRRA